MKRARAKTVVLLSALRQRAPGVLLGRSVGANLVLVLISDTGTGTDKCHWYWY